MNILKKTKAFALINIFAAVACAVVVVWFKQLQPNSVEAQSQKMLTLVVTTPERKYLKLEPILFTYKLLNQNNVPISWSGIPMFGRDINLLIRKDNGDEIRQRQNYPGLPIYSMEIIPPGKSKEAPDLIGADITEQLFPQTGHYQVRVEFSYTDFSDGQRQDVTIISNPITVKIDEPQGVNRRAYDYIKNTLEPVSHKDDMEERIKTYKYFVDNFRNTVYWKYKVYELGYLYSEMKDYEKAEEAFFEISDIDFYYSKKVEKHLWELSGKLKRPSPRSKRPLDLSNMPVARPLPVPTVRTGPLPADAPVPRLIPNPNPNGTP